MHLSGGDINRARAAYPAPITIAWAWQGDENRTKAANQVNTTTWTSFMGALKNSTLLLIQKSTHDKHRCLLAGDWVVGTELGRAASRGNSQLQQFLDIRISEGSGGYIRKRS